MNDVQEAKNWVKLIVHPVVRELENRIGDLIKNQYDQSAVAILNHFTEILFDENSNIVEEDSSLDLHDIDQDGYISILVYHQNKLFQQYVKIVDLLDND